MATTGQELFNLFRQEVDAPYTGQIDVAKANRYFKKAYIQIIQNIYLERLNNQNAFDQLSYLISLNTSRLVNQATNQIFHSPIPIVDVTNVAATITMTTDVPHNLIPGDLVTFQGIAGTVTGTPLTDFYVLNQETARTVLTTPTTTTFTFLATFTPTGVYTPNTGQIFPVNAYTDYLHYLFAKATFIAPYYGVSITTSTNSFPIRMTLDKRTTLRDKDYVLNAGVLGNTNVNGRRYLKYLNEKLYSLYSDENLQTAVNGNGTQTNTGTISQIITSPVKEWDYDQKGAIYSQGTPLIPRVQQGKLVFQIYPRNIPCESMEMDYIKKQPAEIDAANNVIDYERYYPAYFLTKIATEAGRFFGFSQRDQSLVNGETEVLIENP